MKHLLVTGNVVDGFNFVGPFDDVEAAVEYAGIYLKHNDYNIAEMETPQ